MNKVNFRDTAMMMLSVMDPAGTESRRKGRLKRRVYRSKVNELLSKLVVYYYTSSFIRDQTLSGMWMGMTN